MSTDRKMLALAAHFNVSVDEIAVDEGFDTYSCESQPGEYRVLTEDEANEAWEESLDSYLDDCLLCELPDVARQYFDRNAWKRDAKFDGRGHSLSSYDGNEYEEKIDGEWFYIYRTN